MFQSELGESQLRAGQDVTHPLGLLAGLADALGLVAEGKDTFE